MENKDEVEDLSKVIKRFTSCMSPEQILLKTLDELSEHIIANGYSKHPPSSGLPSCEHDWAWSNKMGFYFCKNCNVASYLGKQVSNSAENAKPTPSSGLLPLKADTFIEFGQLMKAEIGRNVLPGLSRRESEHFCKIIDEAYVYARNTFIPKFGTQPTKIPSEEEIAKSIPSDYDSIKFSLTPDTGFGGYVTLNRDLIAKAIRNLCLKLTGEKGEG